MLYSDKRRLAQDVNGMIITVDYHPRTDKVNVVSVTYGDEDFYSQLEGPELSSIDNLIFNKINWQRVYIRSLLHS